MAWRDTSLSACGPWLLSVRAWCFHLASSSPGLQGTTALLCDGTCSVFVISCGLGQGETGKRKGTMLQTGEHAVPLFCPQETPHKPEWHRSLVLPCP